MIKKTSDSSVPHLDVNPVSGGSRQYVHTDMYAIVKKGLPTTDFNQAGSELFGTMIPKTNNTVRLRRELVKAARATGLPVYKAA